MGYAVECCTLDNLFYYQFFFTKEEAEHCKDTAKDYFGDNIKYVKIREINLEE